MRQLSEFNADPESKATIATAQPQSTSSAIKYDEFYPQTKHIDSTRKLTKARTKKLLYKKPLKHLPFSAVDARSLVSVATRSEDRRELCWPGCSSGELLIAEMSRGGRGMAGGATV